MAERTAESPWSHWWAETVEPILCTLPYNASLVGRRQQLLDGFTAHMAPVGMDRFDAAGMAATWWEDSVYELQTAASRGWRAVIEAWLTTAEASQDDKNAPDLADQIAIKLLAGPQLAERAVLAAKHERLDAEIKAAEVSDDDDDGHDDDALSVQDIEESKSARAKARRELKAIDESLLAKAREALDALAPAEAPALAIGVLRSRVQQHMADHFAAIERSTLAWYDNLVHKYGTTLQELEAERDAVAARLQKHLKELGYG